MQNRRDLLKLAAGVGAASAAWNGVIAKALAATASAASGGSIADVEHVVILMQENRSFDHYFGALRGVRGFDDPRALTLPSGQPVWRQPRPGDAGGYIAPFHLNAAHSSAENLATLDHSWKGSHALWKHHDAWISVKSSMTMGHFERRDIPFYYALADAFTVCDAYHCSVFGPTNPNRLYLFTGTSGLTVGQTGPLAIRNPAEEPNETSDRSNDAKSWPGFTWTTYAERLEAAGVSWKVYQEYDNYGDNALAYFQAFRKADAPAALLEKGRSWADGSNVSNAKTSNGEHLAAAFRRDIETGRLPQVSWIVAPYRLCEHPQASPALGQAFTAQLISALADNPDVFAKTVFILNYDENDGFFDHVAPPLPAVNAEMGASTIDCGGEVYEAEPVGLGVRVPMIVVSPWTKGGFVNSEVFDHTSVLRFLEARFGVPEPNISAWRRTVCGDLTSIFDFGGGGADAMPPMPATAPLVARAAANAQGSAPVPAISAHRLPRQEPGRRPARPLPYELDAWGMRTADGTFHLHLDNRGRVGTVFDLRAAGAAAGPWFYTVGAGRRLEAMIAVDGRYEFALRGPNGFFRAFAGALAPAQPEALVALTYAPASDRIILALSNPGDQIRRLRVRDGGSYRHGPARAYRLRAGETVQDAWSIAASAHWYDVLVTDDSDPSFRRRLAGHMETGRASFSDPMIGARAGR